MGNHRISYYFSTLFPLEIQDGSVGIVADGDNTDGEPDPSRGTGLYNLAISKPVDASVVDYWGPCNDSIVGFPALTNSTQLPPTLRPAGDAGLALGLPLQESSDSNLTCISLKVVETVPFGLNIGRPGPYTYSG